MACGIVAGPDRISALRIVTLMCLFAPLGKMIYESDPIRLDPRPITELIHRTGDWALIFPCMVARRMLVAMASRAGGRGRCGAANNGHSGMSDPEGDDKKATAVDAVDPYTRQGALEQVGGSDDPYDPRGICGGSSETGELQVKRLFGALTNRLARHAIALEVG
jgi:hypothetical protein